MAFRDNEMGRLVRENPEEAANQLSTRLAEYDGNVRRLAESLEVPVSTISRWRAKLLDEGFDLREMANAPAKRYWREGQAPAPALKKARSRKSSGRTKKSLAR